MNNSEKDTTWEEAEAAEQRGLAFFNKLAKKSTSSSSFLPSEQEDDSLWMEVDSSPALRQREGGAAKRSATGRQKFPSHMRTPASSSSPVSSPYLSSTRRHGYATATMTSPREERRSDITVSFSFFLAEGRRLPNLSMTLHPSLTIGQVKTMVCKKVATYMTLLPSEVMISLEGRDVRDVSTLADVPVASGSSLKVQLRSEVSITLQQGEEDDSFLKNDHTASFFQTPQAKGSMFHGVSTIKPPASETPLSGPPSSIKPSPFGGVASPIIQGDISGLSFGATATGLHGQMKSLHRPDQSTDLMSHRLTSVQRTYSGGAVMTEEAAFYELLEEVMNLDNSDSCSANATVRRMRAVNCDSVHKQSQLVDAYAQEVADRCEAVTSQLSLHAASTRSHRQLLRRELENLRAERDLWSLSSRLLVQHLFKDVQDAPNEQALNIVLADSSPSTSLKEVINRSICADERIKKGRVLKDWIESASRDQVHEPPSPPEDDSVFPWTETLRRLQRTQRAGRSASTSASPTSIREVHPDAQICSNGYLIPLDGDDDTDQETLLKVIWQHIRSGQLVEAQAVAHCHKLHWLTAALMGVAEEFYSHTEGEPESGEPAQVVARRGNKSRPMWMQVCWKYSQSLDSQAANKTVGRSESGSSSRVAVLESAIYAALSTNYKTLKDSPMLQNFSDHLWAKISCAHERQIVHVSHQFRVKRREFSHLYPGTSNKIIAAEAKYLKDTDVFSSALCGNANELLKDVLHRNKASPFPVNGLLLQLQVAMIQGWSALRDFILNDLRAFVIMANAKSNNVSASDHSDEIAEHCRLLRIFVHFLLWLRYSCPEQKHLSPLASDDILFITLEAYISHLAQRKQYSLVALYCSFLSRPKRLSTYMGLLQVVSPTSVRSEEGHIVPASTLHLGSTATMAGTLGKSLGGNGSKTCMALSGRNTGLRGVDDDATAEEVLTLAKKFFCEEDIVEITNSVVEMARKGSACTTSLKTTFRDLTTSLKKPENSFSSFNGSVGNFMLAAQTAATTVVPGHYDEGDIPPEDAHRLESLRWLCYNEDQFPDAVKEANAFLRSLMIESSGTKSLQMRVLLTNILPSNFVSTGNEFLRLKLEKEEDVISKKNVEDCWDADIGQLMLWKYADWSMCCFENFEKEVQHFYSKQAECLGDSKAVAASLYGHKHQIVRSADKCLKSVRRALLCGSSGEVDMQGSAYFDDTDEQDQGLEHRGGFLGIWCNSVDTTIADILHQLAGHSAQTASYDKNHPSDEIQDDEVVNEITGECFGLLEQLEQDHLPCTANEELGSHIASLFTSPGGLALIKDQLNAITVVSYDTSYVLEKTRDMLKSVIEIRMCMALVASILLNNYVDVCSRTASIMEIINISHEETLLWQQEAVDVAVFVADEAENMQLYKALNVEDLRKILAKVCIANTHILRLQKSFDIHLK